MRAYRPATDDEGGLVSSDLSIASKAAAWATIALGAGQAFAPGPTARAFGLQPLDGESTWLAALLGVSNMTLGSMLLGDARSQTRTQRLGLLAGNAAVTALAAGRGGIDKRTAASVLAFVAALVPGAVAD